MGFLDRPGPESREGQVPVTPLMDHIVLGPSLNQQFFGFVQHLPPLFQGDAETDVLVLVIG